MGRKNDEDVTRLLSAMAAGEARTDDLLPVVYAELRRIARARVRGERSPTGPGATSLVHEAYVRLVGDREVRWESRAHFFVAAGEAMRRIMIERARGRARLKRGGDRQRADLTTGSARVESPAEEMLALDEALSRLEARDRAMADVVKLRYFGGLTVPEAADALGISSRSVNRLWTAARAWLRVELDDG